VTPSDEKRKHMMRLTVRFSDTDMLGHVNNASYFSYMEEARCAFFAELLEDERTAVPMILASAKVNYVAQTFYRQTLRIESWVSRWGNSSFDISCKMFDETTGKLHFEAVAVIVYFDYEAQKPMRVPDAYRATMAAYTHEPD
jgi:acyl-CoA thioester hydrolase